MDNGLKDKRNQHLKKKIVEKVSQRSNEQKNFALNERSSISQQLRGPCKRQLAVTPILGGMG